MNEFFIVFMGVLLALIVSYAMTIALMLNITAGKAMTKKLLKNSKEILKELSSDEDFEEWF